MDIEKKEVSAEELASEQEALQEKKEDEVRSRIITEFGFDEIDDLDRINKLVEKELDHSKKLSSAIGQKIKWRTEATKPRETTPPALKQQAPVVENVEEKLNEILEKRELDNLEYPAELKAEIEKLSKIKGTSIKATLRDPYIVSKVQEYEKTQEADEASISKTNRSTGKKTFSIDNPPDVDMATPEGRAKWDEWKSEMKKKGY